MSLTAEIVSRMAAAGPLPEDVSRTARYHLLDAIGVGFAAATAEVGSAWQQYAKQVSRHGGPATVFGAASGASPAEAALINGGLIHSLEFDDTHTGSIVHGSAVLAAAALAAGEAAGVSGSEFLRSYTLWYEVLIRIGLAAAGGFQQKGFQLTSVGGALAAAGIAANLKGLDAAKAQAAVGIALSHPGVFNSIERLDRQIHASGLGGPCWFESCGSGRCRANRPRNRLEGRFGLLGFCRDPQAAERFRGLLDHLGRSGT